MKERYLRSVHALMDCPARERKRLLSRLNNAVTAYLEDNPEAGETDLIANFGAPEECMPKAVSAERRKKARRNRILTVVLAVLLAAALGVAAYLWSNGGIVTIKISDTPPDFWDAYPSDHIIYHYDN